MAQSYASAFYASDAWHKCREGYIRHRQSVDGGMCEICHERVGYIVHHKKRISPANISDPNVTLSWNNLQYVCKACHDKIHEYGGRFREKRKIIFDSQGNPIVPPEISD